MNQRLTALTLLVVALSTRTGQAEPSRPEVDAPPSQDGKTLFRLDVEVDPTAYVFSGYSAHAGVGYDRLRVDLGAYAMEVPEFFHGNAGFDAEFNGFGAKLQYFPFARTGEQDGAFFGVDGGYARIRATHAASGEAGSLNQVTVGINGGYRIGLPWGFYATPWLGISYALNGTEKQIGAETFTLNPVTFFPAVHLGYRFR